MDVFNITIARQQAEVEVKKAGYRIYREGAKESEENKGWFSWLWTWSESHKQQPDVKPGSLEEMLTPEEKLYYMKQLAIVKRQLIQPCQKHLKP